MGLRRTAHSLRLYCSKAVHIALVLLLSFALSFGLSAPLTAVAAGESDAGTEEPGGSEVPTTPVIDDVGICFTGTENYLGYATAPYQQTATITAKGATLELDHMVYWSNGGGEDRNSIYASWSVSDSSIAKISTNGVLTALADGVVDVYATVSSKTEDGSPLVAKAQVVISGQTDARYVSGIRILDSTGADVTNGNYELKEDLSTAQAQFRAEVDVTDPASGAVQTYSTVNGSLSSQTPDIGNVIWYVGDTNMAAVDETSGLFRPSVYGMTTLSVVSTAGMGNSRMSATTAVNTVDPSGEQADGYHPQDSVTIKAYYELYTPDEYGDEAYVIDKTYSVADIEALGMVTATYTSFSSQDYYTMTGEGSPLSSVLQDAGINIDGIKSFAFSTADWPNGENRPVSASFVFADRYYYPNVDISRSTAGAVQVYPILAVRSNQVRNGNTEPDYNMNEGSRFRLLFGATPEGGNSAYQIKWINTIYVVLSGGPPVEPDNPGNDSDPGDNKESDGSTVAAAGGGGAGTADGSASGGAGGDGTTGTGTLGGEDSHQGESGTTGGEGDGAGTGNFTIYQVMNKDASDTETTFDPDNPWKPYALPIGGGMVIAGGIESYLWFRRQAKSMVVASPAV